jgi:hypothetical protein
MARNREKVLVGTDNRMGLKKLGQLDLQARKRKQARVGQWLRTNRNEVVRVASGYTALVGVLDVPTGVAVAERALYGTEFTLPGRSA